MMQKPYNRTIQTENTQKKLFENTPQGQQKANITNENTTQPEENEFPLDDNANGHIVEYQEKLERKRTERAQKRIEK